MGKSSRHRGPKVSGSGEVERETERERARVQGGRREKRKRTSCLEGPEGKVQKRVSVRERKGAVLAGRGLKLTHTGSTQGRD